MIYLLLCPLLSAGLFMLTTFNLVLLPLGRYCDEGRTKSSNSIGAMVWILVSSSQSKKCEDSFLSVDPHQANLQPNLFLFNSLNFNPTPSFLGIIFDHTLSFSKHASLLKAKFLPYLKAILCISASSWDPS